MTSRSNFFDLVAGEDGVGVAVHSGLDLAKREDFTRLSQEGGRYREADRERPAPTIGAASCGKGDGREHTEPKKGHEGFMILGVVRGSN